ncbi:MAG TPA: alkaline phosphatase family protein, partial [Prosthecobacter sp.]|nr:alkaline phosphatase family protein [Prosthecobacter sp.]
MKFCALLVLGIIIVLGLTSCSKSDSKDHHVILISIDGFPAWMWNDPSLQVPNLRKLAAEGASTKAMTVSNPSITWINHTTLVTGVTPAKHGVIG